VTNVYDAFGRLASSSTNMGGTSRTLSYQHDAAGNRTAADPSSEYRPQCRPSRPAHPVRAGVGTSIEGGASDLGL
jgi:YD repeat-containing protein